jgi:hypothetical protein
MSSLDDDHSLSINKRRKRRSGGSDKEADKHDDEQQRAATSVDCAYLRRLELCVV